MRNAVAAAVLLSVLSGCQTTQEPVAAFNPSEAAYSRSKGVAAVKGQLFLRRNDGVVVYGAGSDVTLIPKVSHTDQAVMASFSGSKIKHDINIFAKNLTFDPGLEPFVRRTKADGQGNFTFDAVPPGAYYVIGKVTWCAPSQYGCNPQGGELLEVLTVSPADKAMTVMLSGA